MNKNVVRFISTFFPGLMVKLAYQQLANPQVRKLRPHELEILDQAERCKIAFNDFQIETYFWEGGPEEVLLIHGWEGQAGNFSDLIVRLRTAGYSVRAFDGPSHGFSSTGPTSLFEFSDLVAVLIRQYGVRKLVSHSFGGVATTAALFRHQDLVIDKYVLLTTPDKFSERIDDVAKMVGITEKVQQRLVAHIENEIGRSVEDVNVSEFVQHIKVGQALLIHDKADKVIPIERSRNVVRNWPQCEMREIEGTGHFRILRTDFVLDQVLDFLADTSPERGK